jgi:reductive dehalogenase
MDLEKQVERSGSNREEAASQEKHDRAQWEKLEQALEPYAKKLKAQERLRRILGIKEVDHPTYERYITGPIGRHLSQKNAYGAMVSSNPYGEDIRKRFKIRTGFDDHRISLPYKELDLEDRFGQSLIKASNRLCAEYDPELLPVTPPEGRVVVKDTQWMSRTIKKVAMFFGGELVRITRIDPRWIYEDITIAHEFAIVVAVVHRPSLNRLAPSHFSHASTTDAYSRLKVITTQLADFIRGIGYDAMLRETRGVAGPELLMVPLAIDAGIGEFARNGRVLSPEFGINMRLKAVTTDMPLAPDKPISFNTHDFCMACEHCAIYCPASAIPYGPPTEEPPEDIFHNPGYTKWWTRAERCLLFQGADKRKWLGCGSRCIAVCPWNKHLNLFHNTVRWMAIHMPRFIKKLLVWSDRVVYHRKKSIRLLR